MTALTISRTVRFLDFEFFPQRRRLERQGEPVGLSSRALDILRVLTDHPGEVVSKQDLLDRVWPHAVVDEGSIRFHMVALRRALGERDGDAAAQVIVTVPGRGYRFDGQRNAPAPSVRAPRDGGLRARLTATGWIVGRDADVAEVSRRLAIRRCVSVVGEGGVGKSAVAVQAAARCRDIFDGGVARVDLGDLADDRPEAIAAALASAVGAPPGRRALLGLLERLADHRTLIVLETCDAAIDGAAQVVAAILRAAPRTSVLATSREALRVEGESLYRLRPLTAPASHIPESAALALTFPAVQLFVDRAANRGGFDLQNGDAPVVADICRRLDGLPLAIEMAATRVAAFGVRGVQAQLSSGLDLSWPGARTAPPRHQSLRANLDWSYDRLPDRERDILCRLSALTGPFSLKVALAHDGAAAPSIQAIAGLTAKSLLSADPAAPGSYRMLEVTRRYARTQPAAPIVKLIPGPAAHLAA
jgi:predicted ATPase/DNA-binding winged helix-turn-helix (wHTH) protein